MRFGNISYGKRSAINIGDSIQLMAIDALYKHMGIDPTDVLSVEWSDIYGYTGEKVILPISFPIYSYGPNMRITCFSDDIIPVFIGLSIIADSLCQEDVDYLNRFSPVGCRDYYTYSVLKKYGIPAYVYGCVTLTLPTVESGTRDRIYCVDISEELSRFVPKEILDNSIKKTQMYDGSAISTSVDEFAAVHYREIFENAGLVITSRMHMAVPCIASGIRTIFARDDYGHTFKGIDRLVRVYSKDEYQNIDWNGNSLKVDRNVLEDVKDKMREIFVSRMRSAYEIYSGVDGFNQFIDQFDYEEHEGGETVIQLEFIRDYLISRVSADESFNCVLWGVTQLTELVYHLVEEQYRHAKVTAVIDSRRDGTFHDIPICRKEDIKNNKEDVVLVCTNGARYEAGVFLSDNGFIRYYLPRQIIQKK